MAEQENEKKSVCSLDAVNIQIGLPGLVAEQRAAYRKMLLGWLDRLANRIDLVGLGSVEITVDYRGEIKKRRLDAIAAGHVATSYVSCAEIEGKPASAHVILDLSPHIGLLGSTADRKGSCLHSLAVAVGHATSSWLFDQRYGLFWEGGPHERWNEVARDCLLAFATSHLTQGIGEDMAEGLLKHQMAMAGEIKSACSEWVRAEAGEEVNADYHYSAWDMSCCYSNFFVSSARWLGVQTAKCERTEGDFARGIGGHAAEWASLFLETMLCIHRKWITAENASAELTFLADLLLGVAIADVAERYPQARDYMAKVEPSDYWPTMLVWPTTNASS